MTAWLSVPLIFGTRASAVAPGWGLRYCLLQRHWTHVRATLYNLL